MNSLETLIAERDRLDSLRDSGRYDTEELRSIAAKRAHLTRKINKAQTATLAPAATLVAPERLTDPDAPMAPHQILTETRTMLAEHGLDGWTVKLSNVMTTTYGLCDYRRRQIRIGARVAALNPADETRNTIAHEVAHAIAGAGTGHGWEWKMACRQTGARPERCHAGETVQTHKPYVGVCDGCGQEAGRRKTAPKPGARHYHKPSACAAPRRGWITWRKED